jgi:hypothetical protein
MASTIVQGQYEVAHSQNAPDDKRPDCDWSAVRWNTELIYLKRSPVGSLGLPYTVGSNGPVVHTNVEANF